MEQIGGLANFSLIIFITLMIPIHYKRHELKIYLDYEESHKHVNDRKVTKLKEGRVPIECVLFYHTVKRNLKNFLTSMLPCKKDNQEKVDDLIQYMESMKEDVLKKYYDKAGLGQNLIKIESKTVGGKRMVTQEVLAEKNNIEMEMQDKHVKMKGSNQSKSNTVNSWKGGAYDTQTKSNDDSDQTRKKDNPKLQKQKDILDESMTKDICPNDDHSIENYKEKGIQDA